MRRLFLAFVAIVLCLTATLAQAAGFRFIAVPADAAGPALTVPVPRALGYSHDRYLQAMPIDEANGINEAMYVPIGGIDQWLQIRGEDINNPVLLWLNGGPGLSTIPSTPDYQSWEKPFTVVMWDQRGEGKTFERSGKSVAPTMTIEKMTEDGIEVAEYLCRHLQKRKIILLGHSWGSMLGIHMIKKRPDLFAAYVGTGQVVDLERDEEAAYPLLLERARALRNMVAEQELKAVGPPPYDESPKKQVLPKWGNQLDPAPGRPDGAMGMGPPPEELKLMLQRAEFSQNLLWQSMLRDNLVDLGLKFDLPIFFIQGVEDRLTVTAVAKDYFDRITAPYKEFVELPGVGHLAIFTDPDAFLGELIERVRPLAISNG
jgi:pimeloyl-ACP methyl ester carboxylesterase